MSLKPTLSKQVFQTQSSWKEFLADQAAYQQHICRCLHSCFQKVPSSFVLYLIFLLYSLLFVFPGTTFLPLLCLPFSAQVPPQDTSIVSLSSLAKFNKPTPKSELPNVVFGANSAFYYTLPGKRGQNHLHKLPVHNSNTLPPHSPRQVSLLSLDSFIWSQFSSFVFASYCEDQATKTKNLHHLCINLSKS